MTAEVEDAAHRGHFEDFEPEGRAGEGRNGHLAAEHSVRDPNQHPHMKILVAPLEVRVRKNPHAQEKIAG